jgi:hypothetical protein
VLRVPLVNCRCWGLGCHAARGTIMGFVEVGKFLNTPYSNYCVIRYVGWEKGAGKAWLKLQELIRGGMNRQVG